MKLGHGAKLFTSLNASKKTANKEVEVEITTMANLETKLKALLAAGLIGTAGLGMQSCSNPSDSVYYPYTVEAPSTDNPGSGGGTENPDNPSDTEEAVTFESLGVQPKYFASLAGANKLEENDIVIKFMQITPSPSNTSYRYLNKEEGFGPVGFKIDPETGKEGQWDGDNHPYICYRNKTTKKLFYVPAGKIADDFDTAIRAYRAAHPIE